MTEFEDEDTGRQAGGKSMVDQRAQPTRAGVIVPDVRGRVLSRTAEARLEEFKGLAEAIDLELVFSEIVKVREIRPATFIGSGHVEDIAKRVKDEKIEVLLVDAPISPDPAAQPREGNRRQGARPHRADPRDFRRARRHQGRHAAGRAGASQVSAEPAGPVVDPPRAPARQRRLRLHGRPRRDADRKRPAHAGRPHQAARGAHREGQEDPHASRRAAGPGSFPPSRSWVTPTPENRASSMR